jgi:hypothetical protein
MNREKVLSEALARLAEVHNEFSAMDRPELGRFLAMQQEWAREQKAALEAAPSVEPEALGVRDVIGALWELWDKAIARCASEEETTRTHRAFCDAVNALCELAAAPVDLKLRGAA